MKTLLIAALILTMTHGTPVENFTKGNRLFTSDIYKEFKKNETSNFLISPFSAEVVLALTQSGAKDATAQELRTSLHLPNNDQDIRSGIRSYLQSLVQDGSEVYQLHSANKIYIKKNLPIKDEFKQIATSDYRADIENVDFSLKSQAAGTINQWVEKQTNNKIHDLIDPSHLGDEVAAILINTLYFQGRWLFEFAKERTKKANFYKSGTEPVKVNMMFKNEKFYDYFESTELKAKFLELPFLVRGVSFVIVLPDEKDGLAALEEKSEKIFTSHEFTPELVNVALPKFKIESKVDFKKILEQLGVSKIFLPEADLSGIAGNKGDLRVAEVLQKTFIDVNEEGVEAAAATEVLALLGSAFVRDPPKEFVVDRPFIFYIKANDVVLFAGRVVDPNN